MDRDLKLNCMKLFELPNDRQVHFAKAFLAQFRLPIRIAKWHNVLELGANNSRMVRLALRLLASKNIKPRKELPWKPPAVCSSNYKGPVNGC